MKVDPFKMIDPEQDDLTRLGHTLWGHMGPDGEQRDHFRLYCIEVGKQAEGERQLEALRRQREHEAWAAAGGRYNGG